MQRHAEDPVKGIRFEGIELATPAPGSWTRSPTPTCCCCARRTRSCRSAPILSVPGVRDAVAARHGPVVGVSPIVGGAPLAGMADKLMPVAGLEVSAIGAARAYRDLLDGWVIDERDADAAPAIADELGITVAVTDTVMRDDDVAAALASDRHRAGDVTIEIWPVEGLPEIREGDDLAAHARRAVARDGREAKATSSRSRRRSCRRRRAAWSPTKATGRSVWVDARDPAGRRATRRPDHRGDASRVRLRERRGGRVQRRGGVRVAPAGRSGRIRGGHPGVAGRPSRPLATRGGHHRYVRPSLAERAGERGDRVRRVSRRSSTCAAARTITDASWRSRSSPWRTRWRRRAGS